MTLFENIKTKSFWREVFKMGALLFFAFFIIVLLLTSPTDIFSGNFSDVIQDNFTGDGAVVFFGSVITTSLIGSFALVTYDIEEKLKEEEEAII